MQLTETVKLYPNKYQTELIKATMTEYISTVNHLVLDAINGRAITKITTADVNAALPSALCNQCIRDAKSIIRKYNKDIRNVQKIQMQMENRGGFVLYLSKGCMLKSV